MVVLAGCTNSPNDQNFFGSWINGNRDHRDIFTATGNDQNFFGSWINGNSSASVAPIPAKAIKTSSEVELMETLRIGTKRGGGTADQNFFGSWINGNARIKRPDPYVRRTIKTSSEVELMETTNLTRSSLTCTNDQNFFGSWINGNRNLLSQLVNQALRSKLLRKLN